MLTKDDIQIGNEIEFDFGRIAKDRIARYRIVGINNIEHIKLLILYHPEKSWINTIATSSIRSLIGIKSVYLIKNYTDQDIEALDE